MNIFDGLPPEILAFIAEHLTRTDHHCIQDAHVQEIVSAHRDYRGLISLRRVSRVAADLPVLNARLFRDVVFYYHPRHVQAISQRNLSRIGKYVRTLDIAYFPWSSTARHRIGSTAAVDREAWKLDTVGLSDYLMFSRLLEDYMTSVASGMIWKYAFKEMKNLSAIHIVEAFKTSYVRVAAARSYWTGPPEILRLTRNDERYTSVSLGVKSDRILSYLVNLLKEVPSIKLRELSYSGGLPVHFRWRPGPQLDVDRVNFSLLETLSLDLSMICGLEPFGCSRDLELSIWLLLQAIARANKLRRLELSCKTRRLIRFPLDEDLYFPDLAEISLTGIWLQSSLFKFFVQQHLPLGHVELNHVEPQDEDEWSDMEESLWNEDHLSMFTIALG